MGNRKRRDLWVASLRLAVLGVFSLLLAGRSLAQPVELAARLKDLNIRVKTDHYALAGTVTDVRLQQYAQALEAIHAEYEKGFSELLSERKPEAAKPATGPKKRKTTNGTTAGTKRTGSTAGNQATDDVAAKGKSAKPTGAGSKRSAGADGSSTSTMGQPDEEGRFFVIVLATAHDYQEFGRAFLGGDTEFSIGMFIPALDVLLIQDRGNLDDTCEVLFHEAFHQFMHRYVPDPPTWLDEGLAMFYENARPGRQGLTFRRPSGDRWKLARKLIEKHSALPLWQVVSASHAVFYDTTPERISGFRHVTRKDLYYVEAYTLVDLLLSDQSAQQRVRDYIRDLARPGRAPSAVTREYFGPDVCEYLTEPWKKHVQRGPQNR